MDNKILFPKLAAQDTDSILQRLRNSSGFELTFDAVFLEEKYSEYNSFATSGGNPIDLESLIELRNNALEIVQALENKPSTSDKQAYDLRMGELLFSSSLDSTSSMGDPQVWNFVTFALLPDVANYRFPTSDSLSIERFIGGNRRHLFQRLWKRWKLLGSEIVGSGSLSEDDYLQIIDRRLFLERPALAKVAATEIIETGLTSDKRRQFSRLFLRIILQTSALVVIDDSDSEHLVSVVEYASDMAKAMISEA